MSQTTIDQTDADKDQAAFDADMEYMCELVDLIGSHRAQDSIALSKYRELSLLTVDLYLDGKILGADGTTPWWPTDDPAADLLDDWRYGPITHGAYCPCGSRLEIRGELDAEDYEAINDFGYVHQDCTATQNDLAVSL